MIHLQADEETCIPGVLEGDCSLDCSSTGDDEWDTGATAREQRQQSLSFIFLPTFDAAADSLDSRAIFFLLLTLREAA